MAARRTYRLGKRSERTAQARQRVLDSAIELFRASGFHDVTFDALARHSGVGRTTVFDMFRTKTELLRSVEAEVSRRAGVEGLLVSLSAGTALDQLEAAFRQGALVWGAERELFRKLFGQATVDAELHAVMAEKDAGRQQLCRVLAQRLAREGALRADAPVIFAAQVLEVLTSFHSFDLLAGKASPRRTGEVLWRMASQVLLMKSR